MQENKYPDLSVLPPFDPLPGTSLARIGQKTEDKGGADDPTEVTS